MDYLWVPTDKRLDRSSALRINPAEQKLLEIVI